MRVLYISHNGILEGLGRLQVLAYLRGLARRGVEFDLFSYEVADADRGVIEELAASLTGTGIRWTPLVRTKDSRLRVKLLESGRGVAHAFGAALARRPDIVHGRSYLPTAIADMVATVLPRTRLVFDCRGMLGDEYVDAGHWTRDRLEYRLLKRYEARAFHRANGVVVLTRALERWIRERGWFGARTHVEVIPCCVDLDAFRFDAGDRARVRAELGLEGRTVIAYSGSLGSWYRERDMARLAGIVKRRASGPVSFLLLTRSAHADFHAMLRAEGLAEDEIVVRGVRPDQMSSYLSSADVGLSFIKSCFSKMGSSPTKVAEYLACGLPVVLNGDIGDQADLASEREACVVVDAEMTDETLADAAGRALALAARPLDVRVAHGRRVADEHFGLERVGVARYERLYRAVTA